MVGVIALAIGLLAAVSQVSAVRLQAGAPVAQSEIVPRRQSGARSAFAYTWMSAAFFLMIWGHNHSLPMSFSAMALSVAGIVGLVIVRQWVALNENARLSGQLQDQLVEREQAAQALRQARDQLEVRVQERTVELATANQGLQTEIAERKRAEQQIQISLQEKEVLLKEIHHRVKNNLQVVSSLLNLQSNQAQDPTCLEVLRDSQNRVRSMALIHEKIYQSQDLARVDLAEYLHSLTAYLFHSYQASARAITLQVDVSPHVCLGIDQAIPCGLIVNELVSNALKHAFPAGRPGQVRVELGREEAGRLRLTVGDDGVGFPAGLDFRNTESLGLQLVMTLAGQLDGSIELASPGSPPGGGTAFCITFTEAG
jgi:two-component sensor histidine kinase